MASFSRLIFFLAAVPLLAQEVKLSAPAPPPVSGVSVKASVHGNGNYCYWVVAVYPIGKSLPTGPVCVLGADLILGTITVSWNSASGATSYDVLRMAPGSSLPSGSATIAVSTAIVGNSATDSGGALASYAVSSAPPATANFWLNNWANAQARVYSDTPFHNLTLYTLSFGDGTKMSSAATGGTYFSGSVSGADMTIASGLYLFDTGQGKTVTSVSSSSVLHVVGTTVETVRVSIIYNNGTPHLVADGVANTYTWTSCGFSACDVTGTGAWPSDRFIPLNQTLTTAGAVWGVMTDLRNPENAPVFTCGTGITGCATNSPAVDTTVVPVVGTFNSTFAEFGPEDFNFGGVTSGTIGKLGWAMDKLATNACTSTEAAAEVQHPGVIQMTTSATGATDGCSMNLSNAAQGSSVILNDLSATGNGNWEIRAVVKSFSTITNTGYFVGLNTAGNTYRGTHFAGVRYDTSGIACTGSGNADATHWVFEVDSTCVASAVTVATSTWYWMRIVSVGGAVSMDVSTTPTFSGPTAVGTMWAAVSTPVIQSQNRTTASTRLSADWFDMQITGLTR